MLIFSTLSGISGIRALHNSGGGSIMAKLALVYGMRLLPADEISSIGEAEVKLRSGKKAHVTMHLIEGGEQEVRNQLMQSLDAFFEFYPEI
jgi:hypothetical protein